MHAFHRELVAVDVLLDEQDASSRPVRAARICGRASSAADAGARHREGSLGESARITPRLP